jgi:hypothetical protein
LSMTLSTTSGTSNETWGFSLDGSITTTFLLFGGMLENGDIATDYIATTTAAVSVGPVSGLPRLDYLNSSCPRLLLEPQRTNILPYSEQWNNVVWGYAGLTVSSNQAVSPDGYTNADLITEDTSTGSHVINQAATTTNASWTWSVFMKSNGKEWVYLRIADSGNIARYAYFNLLTGSVGTVNAQITSATITNYGNGWYRCAATIGTARAANSLPQVGLAGGDNVVNYTGNGVSGVYLYGAQLELGSYASSYLNTLSTSVTRSSEAASKTGISSLIGQTEGVLFFDFIFKTPEATSNGQIGISNPTSPRDRVLVWNNFALNTLAANLQVNGANIFNTSLGTFVDGQRYKIAIAYKSGSNAAYVNGTQIFTNTNTFTFASTMSDFILGAYETAMIARHQLLNQALLFKTRLTNAQLAELTTL